MSKLKQLSSAIGIVTTLAVTVVGCAQQQFVKQQFSAPVSAANAQQQLAPKVDILIMTDNTGSTNTALSILQSEITSFVTSLQSQNWDYHLAAAPIALATGQAYYPITQVLVNSAYNTDTAGTLNAATEIVPAGMAITNPSEFNLTFPVQGYGNGDNTYINMYNTLNSSVGTAVNFLRPDAPLAIIVVTNGYDATVTNSQGAFTATGQANLTTYASELIKLKGTASMLRFYPIAAYAFHSGQGASTCLASSGGQSFIGTSYFEMVDQQGIQGLSDAPDSTGSGQTDFCNPNSLANVFTDIASNMTTLLPEFYITSALVLQDQPLINSDFQVTKNGNVLSQDPNNGWEYLGYKTNYCTEDSVINTNTNVISPITPCLNQQTGYVIQLNGSAQMWGGDVPNVTTDHP